MKIFSLFEPVDVTYRTITDEDCHFNNIGNSLGNSSANGKRYFEGKMWTTKQMISKYPVDKTEYKKQVLTDMFFEFMPKFYEEQLVVFDEDRIEEIKERHINILMSYCEAIFRRLDEL